MGGGWRRPILKAEEEPGLWFDGRCDVGLGSGELVWWLDVNTTFS
jgi:hypothetical protein